MKTTNRASAIITVTLAAVVALASCSSASTSAGSKATDNSLNTIKPGVVRVASQPDNKPYSYNDNGKNVGLDTELVETIAKHLNLKVEIVQMDFASMIPSVVSGSVDIAASSVSNTEARRKIVNFSDPTLFGPEAVITRKGSGVTKDTGSLAGKRLGVNQGTVQDAYAQAHWKANIVRFPDNNSGVAALKTGSIDAVFMDAPLAADFAAADSKLEIAIGISDITDPYGIVFNKKNPKLRDAFNKELKALIADGTLQKLQEKYLPNLPINKIFKPIS